MNMESTKTLWFRTEEAAYSGSTTSHPIRLRNDPSREWLFDEFAMVPDAERYTIRSCCRLYVEWWSFVVNLQVLPRSRFLSDILNSSTWLSRKICHEGSHGKFPLKERKKERDEESQDRLVPETGFSWATVHEVLRFNFKLGRQPVRHASLQYAFGVKMPAPAYCRGSATSRFPSECAILGCVADAPKLPPWRGPRRSAPARNQPTPPSRPSLCHRPTIRGRVASRPAGSDHRTRRPAPPRLPHRPARLGASSSGLHRPRFVVERSGAGGGADRASPMCRHYRKLLPRRLSAPSLHGWFGGAPHRGAREGGTAGQEPHHRPRRAGRGCRQRSRRRRRRSRATICTARRARRCSRRHQGARRRGAPPDRGLGGRLAAGREARAAGRRTSWLRRAAALPEIGAEEHRRRRGGDRMERGGEREGENKYDMWGPQVLVGM
jgi:hypothetical protein